MRPVRVPVAKAVAAAPLSVVRAHSQRVSMSPMSGSFSTASGAALVMRVALQWPSPAPSPTITISLVAAGFWPDTPAAASSSKAMQAVTVFMVPFFRLIVG
jgi:hypothetical protein